MTGSITIREATPADVDVVMHLPLQPARPRSWIVNMYTEPEYRRQGLARRLMEAMVEWCRGQRMANVYLHASDEGRPLYDALGFKSSNEMRLAL